MTHVEAHEMRHLARSRTEQLPPALPHPQAMVLAAGMAAFGIVAVVAAVMMAL